ncbi:MAG: hypothetical protein LC624_09550 [Halobacteriales archaeon]|nr:hypothetical protein [Halobacteriales archaeon]
MVAKLVCLGSFALLIATASIAAADAPAWCGVENLNVVRNVNDCLVSEPHTQGSNVVSTDLPQVVIVPTVAVKQPVSISIEPQLVVAQVPALPFALAHVIPINGQQFPVAPPQTGTQFTCIVGEPVPAEFCDAMYAVAAAVPFGGFR